MIPEGWRLCAANDLCHSISVGIVIKPSQYYVSENNGIKAFRSANVREGVINDSNWVYLSQEGHDVNKKSQLKENDILIVRTGYPGTACVVTKEFEGSNAIDIVIARPNKEKILPEYLCAFTNSEFGKAQVLNLQGGMAQKHLNVGAYKSLQIKLPTVKEQKKIAKILSTWDKAIETVEKMIENSRAQKKSLMQQLLTGKKRFAGFEGEWEKVKIKQIGKIVSGGTPNTAKDEYWNGNIYWVTPTDITKLSNQFISNTNRKITEVGMNNSSANLVPKGSLLVCTRATVGAMAITTYSMTTNQGFKNVIPNEQVDIHYVYYLLSQNKYYLISMASGSTFLELSKKDFENLSFRIPIKAEQQKIASVLTNADKEIELLEQQLSYLKQEKKALMQQLLTGKRRVIVDTTDEALC